MKRFLYLSIIGFLSILTVNAQNEVDALRYGQTNMQGSARFISMGGAFGALGGDISVMATNPAGIGVYRSSNTGFSFGWNNQNIGTSFNGSNHTVDDVNFKPTNLGFVAAGVAVGNSDWNFINIGFSYTQLMNYNTRFTIDGTNTTSSLLDWEADKLNAGWLSENYSSYYLSGAILYDESNNRYINDYIDAGSIYNLEQTHTFSSIGYAGEYNFAVAGNYLDKLYVGGAIGLQQIRYQQTISHQEIPNNNIALVQFNSEDNLQTKGSGFNLKAGFIYKVNQMFRFGLSAQTPTIFNIKDDYWTNVTTTFTENGSENTWTGKAPSGSYNWEYLSPLKGATSVAFVFGSRGMVSADYEVINYKGMHMSAQDYFFDDENQAIKKVYQTSQNFRLGGEYKLGHLSLRGGFAYLGSPFANNTTNKNAYQLIYSGGLGIVAGDTYFDAAYQYSKSDENYYMYNYSDAMAGLQKSNSSFVLTLGFKF